MKTDMAIKQVLCMVLLGFLISCTADDNDDFVNPSDLLNFDPVNIRMKTKVHDQVQKEEILKEQEEKGSSQKDEIILKEFSKNFEPSVSIEDSKENSSPNCETVKPCPQMKDLAFFKRYIMSLVHHIESKIDSSEVPVDFCMKMQASYDDLLLLKHYGTGGADNIHEVHDKLEKMFHYVTELPQDGTIFWLEKKLGLSTPNLLLVVAILLLGLISIRLLMRIRITRSLIAKGLLFAFLFSTGTTFIELYQQKVADQEKILTQQITDRCPHLSDTIFSRMKFYVLSAITFQDENCREYYEALVVNPLFKVTILEAASIAFVKTVVSNLKIIGHGLKDFIVGFFKDLPIQYTMYSSILIVMLVVIMPFLLCSYTIRIPLLLTLYPPSPSSQPKAVEHTEQVSHLEETKRVSHLEYDQQSSIPRHHVDAQSQLNTLLLSLQQNTANKPEQQKEDRKSTTTSKHTWDVASKQLTCGSENNQLIKVESQPETENLQLRKSEMEELQLSNSESQLNKFKTKEFQPGESEKNESKVLNDKPQNEDKSTIPFVPFKSQEQAMLISGHIAPVPKIIIVHGEGDEEPKKHVKESSSYLVDLAISSTPIVDCGERNTLSNTDFFFTLEER